MNHPTVELHYILGETLQIDSDIAPVIECIWRLDLRTSSSCQGDPGGEWAHLMLTTEDTVRLLNIISSLAPHDDYDEGDTLGFSTLYYRMAPWELVTHEHPRRWVYTTGFYRDRPSDLVHAGTLVQFPHEDIPVLASILSRAVRLLAGDDDEG